MVKPRVVIPEVLPPTGSEQERLRAEHAALRERIESYSSWLDTAYPIPGTPIRFGWDGILGLIPGVGDVITGALSFYVVAEAARAGVGTPVLIRMLGNAAFDSALGTIPVVGDLFDVAFKANRRNAQLLLGWIERPERVERRSKVGVALVLGGCVLFFIALIVGAALLSLWIARSLGLIGA